MSGTARSTAPSGSARTPAVSSPQPPGPAVLYRRLDADLPAYRRAHPDDAGADLIARQECRLEPGQSGRIPSNIAVALPPGYYALVSGRSSLNSRGILTHLGTIDPGFRGPISVAITNLSGEPFIVQRGDAVAQLVVLPLVVPRFEEAEDLPDSERGERGWGSSGR